MRYVIGVLIVTGLIVWDGVYHGGRYLEGILNSIQAAASMIAQMV
jgi:hypothetical protein